MKLGGDLAVQAHLDGVQTGGLDGAVELDALALDLDAQLVLDGVGDHGVGHGAEELALVADLGVDEDGLAIDDGLQSLGIGDALSLALLDVVTTLLELLDVALGGRQGHAVGEQEVLSEPLGDLDDVALSALALELTQKDDFHGHSLLSCGRDGHHGWTPRERCTAEGPSHGRA